MGFAAALHLFIDSTKNSQLIPSWHSSAVVYRGDFDFLHAECSTGEKRREHRV